MIVYDHREDNDMKVLIVDDEEMIRNVLRDHDIIAIRIARSLQGNRAVRLIAAEPV